MRFHGTKTLDGEKKKKKKKKKVNFFHGNTAFFICRRHTEITSGDIYFHCFMS